MMKISAALPLTLAAVAFLMGCAGPEESTDGAACEKPDKAVVEEIMATARTNFTIGSGFTSRFEFVEGATTPIPAEVQKYGARELMVLLVDTFGRPDDVFESVLGPVYVVLDGEGKPLGPLGTFSQNYFDLQPPAEPGWTAWADGVDDSDVAYDLFGCVNPSR